ncbi:protein-tyrosine-phosphatase IBR5 [Selaginella moellendorffii]|nr:protein-tyrosine-phosphatase IBR5 [Selaginella moellendorffii]|eukprot:XP_002989990.2 protein-tyrosine-phosphatase IBR5 [Selaginella moellendorffii]
MRKRERENPCFICNHYHKFEDGEPCGVCGHRRTAGEEKCSQQSAFSAEILPFLFLGSYDNASRAELLKAQGITHILNTVARCQNLYKNSFTYHCIQEERLPLEECLDFIEKSRQNNAKVLVHCMSGQSRSPAVVIAYLMRHKGWRLSQSYEWVKERSPSVKLNPEVEQQLQQLEKEIFGNSFTSQPGGQAFASSITAAVGGSLPILEATSPAGFAFSAGFNPTNFAFTAQPVPVPGADQNMDGSQVRSPFSLAR